MFQQQIKNEIGDKMKNSRMYSGKTDKDNNEILVGDILEITFLKPDSKQVSSWRCGKVEYKQGITCVIMIDKNGVECMYDINSIFDDKNLEFKIVGNIYDHPKLWKEEIDKSKNL